MTGFDRDRKDFADAVAKAVRAFPCFQPQDGWVTAEVTETVATSGCPVIRVHVPHMGTFNITVTRART